MRYFLDTEFHEDGTTETLRLISLGIVSEDGRSFYAENSEIDHKICNPWVQKNVIPHLTGPTMSRKEIAAGVRRFLGYDGHPRFWGWFCDYDWVLFCQCFGSMLDLPPHFPQFCLDLRQVQEQTGRTGRPQLVLKTSDMPRTARVAHNALYDAHWTKALWEHLGRP